MTDKQQTEAGLKSLYQITGEIADINTILVNRGEFHRLQVDLEHERMRLFACGVVAMADTPDSAREARAMHPDCESASCDDVKRRVDECIALRARVAELEDVLTNLPLSSLQRMRARIQRLEEMLAAVGAGGVGPLMPVTVQHQRESSSDNDLPIENGQSSTTSSSVPFGYKLVPLVPTVEMMDAGGAATRRCYQHLNKGEVMCSYVYRHMIDAAPQPPVVEQPQIDWQDLHQKEKRRAEMWIAKYEQDIGKLERAIPMKQPQGGEKQPDWPKLDNPARVGNGTFGVGTSSQHVVMAAQRAHDEHVRAGALTHDQMVEEERNRRKLWDLIHGFTAAPQPPTTEQSSAVQLQGKHQPVAEVIESHVRAGLDGRFTAEVAGLERLSVGAELFIHPQNLRCKSSQARLATLWGYVKEQPCQPQGENNA